MNILYETYVGSDSVYDFIVHSGVKGQKHGVRQYQYKDGSLTPLGRIHYGVGPPRGTKKDETPKGIINRKPKITARRMSVEEARRLEMQHNIRNSHLQKRKIKGAHSQLQDLKAVNPHFSDGDPQYCLNCTMCTVAYELRRRGYDVEANGTALAREVTTIFNDYFVTPDDIPFIKSATSLSGLEKAFDSMPNTSRGMVYAGAGEYDIYHAMSWEKDESGNVKIYDPQANESYDSVSGSIIHPNSQYPYLAHRIDNMEINWDMIGDAVHDRGYDEQTKSKSGKDSNR